MSCYFCNATSCKISYILLLWETVFLIFIVSKIQLVIWRAPLATLTLWLTSAWSHLWQNLLSQTAMVRTYGTQDTQSSHKHQAVVSAVILITCHTKTSISPHIGEWQVETLRTSWTSPHQWSLLALSRSQLPHQYHPKLYSTLLLLSLQQCYFQILPLTPMKGLQMEL